MIKEFEVKSAWNYWEIGVLLSNMLTVILYLLLPNGTRLWIERDDEYDGKYSVDEAIGHTQRA